MNKNILGIMLLMFLVFSMPAFAGDKLITERDLEGKSLQDLYLMRNAIFAKHGRPFNTYELYAYFRGKGYEPDKNYSDKRLSKTELKNINIILEKEKKLAQNNYIEKQSRKLLNFNNVINKFQFPSFTKEETEKFSTNGFLVSPANHQQLFHVYEKNDYDGIASFITTDLVMQLSHIFFDTTLKRIEEESLYPAAEVFTEGMIQSSDKMYNTSKNTKIKEASKRNIAYFAVPYYYLLQGRKLADKDKDGKVNSSVGTTTGEIISAADLKTSGIPLQVLSYNKVQDYIIDKINKSNQHAHIQLTRSSDELPYKGPFDYSQFIPRGHYTRSELLKKYFMALLWFGTFSFDIEDDMELTQAFLMVHQLFTDKVKDRYLIEYWRDIYDVTAFYVGYADDLGPDDFKGVSDKVFGKSSADDYADPKKLAKARKMLKDIFNKKTKIRQFIVYEKGPEGAQFRFMGQRYIPDSEVMQRLVKAFTKNRVFPKGLDVMAAFGSTTAKDLMLTRLKDDWADFPEYPAKLEKLIKQFGALQEKEWKQNLYYSWLWSLKAIFELSKKQTYPFFMNNDAYLHKNLNSSLASWTQLRHDTILYAKQSYGAECGGGEGEGVWEWIPEPPKGYVEPNVEFYNRLIELLWQARYGLEQRKLLGRTGNFFNRFIEAVTFLQNVSEKELNNEPLKISEYEQIRRFGSLVDSLTLSIMEQYEWYSVAGPDKRIQLVADVHTAPDRGMVLEEGVGSGFEIYVIVEIDGRLKLTKGAVFSYYEFQWPLRDRLTDEKWQAMIDQGKQPPLPEWIDIYFSNNPKKALVPAYVPTREIRWKIGDREPGWEKIYYDTGS